MPTDKLQILTPIVTSVNGQTGDATISIPSKTSDLTNDSGFLTQHQSLDNYATIEYVNSNAPTAITNAKIDEICGETILLAEDVPL